jgi:hypothetical protein
VAFSKALVSAPPSKELTVVAAPSKELTVVAALASGAAPLNREAPAPAVPHATPVPKVAIVGIKKAAHPNAEWGTKCRRKDLDFIFYKKKKIT